MQLKKIGLLFYMGFSSFEILLTSECQCCYGCVKHIYWCKFPVNFAANPLTEYIALPCEKIWRFAAGSLFFKCAIPATFNSYTRKSV